MTTSAVLALGGTNSFTGGISINSGTLQIAGRGLVRNQWNLCRQHHQ